MLSLNDITAWQWESPETHRAKVPSMPLPERQLLAELSNKLPLTASERCLKKALLRKIQYRIQREKE